MKNTVYTLSLGRANDIVVLETQSVAVAKSMLKDWRYFETEEEAKQAIKEVSALLEKLKKKPSQSPMEVIFKGKSIYTGDGWFEGYFVKRDDGSCFIIENMSLKGVFRTREVIPETVGLYIGLQDKNGKRIFGNDLVRHDSSEKIEIVTWKNGAFGTGGMSFDELENEHSMEITSWEVVGNLYDDLELLK